MLKIFAYYAPISYIANNAPYTTKPSCQCHLGSIRSSLDLAIDLCLMIQNYLLSVLLEYIYRPS